MQLSDTANYNLTRADLLSPRPLHHPHIPPAAAEAVALLQGCFVGKTESFEQSSRGGVTFEDPGFQAVEVEVIYRPVGDEPNTGTTVAMVAVGWTPNTDTDLGVAVASVDGVERTFTDQATDR